MKKALLAASAFIAGLSALPAVAQDSGFYAGAALGGARARQLCSGAINCDDGETAFRGFVGYQINKYVSAEGGYQYFTMFGRNGQGISASALDASAVASAPVMDQLSVYGRAGAYWAKTKSAPNSEDNAGWLMGVGGEYSFSRELGARLEWQHYNNVGGGTLGFNTDIDVLSVGIVWRLR